MKFQVLQYTAFEQHGIGWHKHMDFVTILLVDRFREKGPEDLTAPRSKEWVQAVRPPH